MKAEVRTNRIGTRGEFAGVVYNCEDGKLVFTTGRLRGRGCKARGLALAREWCQKNGHAIVLEQGLPVKEGVAK